MRFKKGEITQESYKVIIYDLECLDIVLTKNNQYHLDILKGNLKDIFGVLK